MQSLSLVQSQPFKNHSSAEHACSGRFALLLQSHALHPAQLPAPPPRLEHRHAPFQLPLTPAAPPRPRLLPVALRLAPCSAPRAAQTPQALRCAPPTNSCSRAQLPALRELVRLRCDLFGRFELLQLISRSGATVWFAMLI